MSTGVVTAVLNVSKARESVSFFLLLLVVLVVVVVLLLLLVVVVIAVAVVVTVFRFFNRPPRGGGASPVRREKPITSFSHRKSAHLVPGSSRSIG